MSQNSHQRQLLTQLGFSNLEIPQYVESITSGYNDVARNSPFNLRFKFISAIVGGYFRLVEEQKELQAQFQAALAQNAQYQSPREGKLVSASASTTTPATSIPANVRTRFLQLLKQITSGISSLQQDFDKFQKHSEKHEQHIHEYNKTREQLDNTEAEIFTDVQVYRADKEMEHPLDETAMQTTITDLTAPELSFQKEYAYLTQAIQVKDHTLAPSKVREFQRILKPGRTHRRTLDHLKMELTTSQTSLENLLGKMSETMKMVKTHMASANTIATEYRLTLTVPIEAAQTTKTFIEAAIDTGRHNNSLSPKGR